MTMNKAKTVMDRVEENFPAPGFREHQQESIAKIVKALEDLDKDVVQLDAPTGAGKSLILHTAARTYYHGLEKDEIGQNEAMMDISGMMDDGPPQPIREGIFFTTPLNSLVDQISDDEFISPHVKTLKGRNNYKCIHPEDSGSKVNEAICQRDQGFDCEVKGDCPYYGRKYDALQHPEVVTSMSYLMAEGMIPGSVKGTFGNRDVLIVDECQKLEDFAMNFISFTVSNRTVPDDVWSQLTIPDEDKEDDVEYLINWVESQLLTTVKSAIEYRESQALMSKNESQELENLQQFEMRVNNFLEDVKNNDWIAQVDWEVNKNSPNQKKIVFKPIEIGRFLDNLLWSRADKIILSSATIPKGDWMEEIGLGDKDAGKVTVPSTFPVENRPINVDQAVGKMTYNEREDNAWPMAQKIKQIAEFHDGKGMVHCRSYGIAEMLKRSFYNHKADEDNVFDKSPSKWFKENCMVQDKFNREESLEEWQASDKKVFFSVAMDEGVSLDDDKCRFQILAKTLYKSMADKRVKFRVQERNEWDWYNRHAAIQIAQAYGRAVRGPDDWAVFYILDESAVGLIDRNDHLFPGWFLEAIGE
jgi:Rad3-related DNA helicase